MTHWSASRDNGDARSSAADVEMTSYVLLATLHGLDQSQASTVLPIVRWLSTQRNSYGGFSSTQVSWHEHTHKIALKPSSIWSRWDCLVLSCLVLSVVWTEFETRQNSFEISCCPISKLFSPVSNSVHTADKTRQNSLVLSMSVMWTGLKASACSGRASRYVLGKAAVDYSIVA